MFVFEFWSDWEAIENVGSLFHSRKNANILRKTNREGFRDMYLSEIEKVCVREKDALAIQIKKETRGREIVRKLIKYDGLVFESVIIK